MLFNDLVCRFGRCISSDIAIEAISLGYEQLAYDIFLLGFTNTSDIVDAMIKDVEEGHLRIFRWFSAFQPHRTYVNVGDSTYNRTMLHVAAWGGRISLVLHLLGLGADPNAQDCFGQSPLHIVATRWNSGLARILLDCGADPNAKNCFGQSPLHIAATRRNTRLARILLDWGADANSPDHEKRTSLHYAVNSLRMVRLLLSRGADVHKKDINLCTRSPTVRFLLMKAERKRGIKRTMRQSDLRISQVSGIEQFPDHTYESHT